MEPEQVDFRPQLNDEQWALIADLFADPAPDPRGGRPRADARRCLEGNSLGAPERIALEAFASLLSFVRDLLAAICRLVRRGHL